MNCREVEARLGAYLDGELDASERAAVGAHLKTCAGCTAVLDRLRGVRTAVKNELAAYRAPDTLRMRVRDAVREAAPTVSTPRTPLWTWLAVAAAVVVTAIGSWKVASDRAAATALADELLAAHVRSLLPGHLTDVPSSDQHTVKPWFNGKLDFSPPVPDEAADGYPLVGGRLDYVGDRLVAALVYARRLHRINVFVWPGPAEPLAGEATRAERNGYRFVRWAAGGMVFWAVSDLDQAELDAFVRLVARADSAAAP